ncbi:hypothetical protein C2845_PM09G12490 [Panicum miliaceum]|uniref:Uncharacterized protein n=1 Tax=Panicum miliaceum TaxID=4540 RepID=A0A3L6S2Z4_PANMI|nr:hypothetical protein C2845_PM09G12490 [Panicum miliaceum]
MGESCKGQKKTASTPTPNVVEIESNKSNMQLALVPAQNDGKAPQLVPAQNDDEENGEAPQPDRGSPTPIVEEIATNVEGEIRADLEALEHDPGKRIPISSWHTHMQIPGSATGSVSAAVAAPVSDASSSWVLDSGASFHVTSDRSQLVDCKTVPDGASVQTADGSSNRDCHWVWPSP